MVAAALPAFGAPGDLPSMDLPQALDYARQHQPQVQAALARLAAQQATAGVPRALWLPTLGATVQAIEGTVNTTTGSVVISPVLNVPSVGSTPVVTSPGTTSGLWKPYTSTFAAVGTTQEVYDFGRIAAKAAVEDARVEVEKQRAGSTMLDVGLMVEEAYFAVLASKSVQQASEDAYQRAKAHRDFARAGVQSGLRSPIELTRAEAELDRRDTARLRAQGGVQQAQAVLAAAVGTPDRMLDAGAAPATSDEIPSLTNALSQAAQKAPELLAVIAQLRAQEAETRAVQADWLPDLHFTATIGARAGGAPVGTLVSDTHGWAPDVPNWDVGLILTLPIFDGVTLARTRAARAVESVRRAELAAALQQQISQIQQVYVALDVARRALPGLQQSVQAAKANYAQADARFQAGLGTSVELADAEALRTDAEIQLALGTFDVARARAALGRAIAEGL